MDNACLRRINDFESGEERVPGEIQVFGKLRFRKRKLLPYTLPNARTHVIENTEKIFIHRRERIVMTPVIQSMNVFFTASSDPAIEIPLRQHVGIFARNLAAKYSCNLIIIEILHHRFEPMLVQWRRILDSHNEEFPTCLHCSKVPCEAVIEIGRRDADNAHV